MTHEEFGQAAFQLVREFWDSKYRPANLLNTEHNALTLLQGVWNFRKHSGAMPGIRDMGAILMTLGDMDAGGKLQYHHAAKVIVQKPAPPPDPSANLPHDGIKELRYIRNLTDVKRVTAYDKEKIYQFKYLRPGSPAYKEFEERINYIKEHRIEGESSLPSERKSEQKPATFVRPADVMAAHGAVAAMTVADVGQTGSSAGRRTLLTRKQEHLHGEIDQMWRNGKTPRDILQWTNGEIRRFGESGIR